MVLRKTGRQGFSLVELVVVIVIIGILAAIAIPRLSRGASGAGESAVKANLAALRSAIAMYAAEHNGAFPGPDAAGFEAKLTKYTDIDGNTSDTKTSTHIYGPYLLKIPPCPVGENAGKATANKVLVVTTSPPVPNPAGGEGWVYNASTGVILPNTSKSDEQGNPYTTY